MEFGKEEMVAKAPKRPGETRCRFDGLGRAFPGLLLFLPLRGQIGENTRK